MNLNPKMLHGMNKLPKRYKEYIFLKNGHLGTRYLIIEHALRELVFNDGVTASLFSPHNSEYFELLYEESDLPYSKDFVYSILESLYFASLHISNSTHSNKQL